MGVGNVKGLQVALTRHHFETKEAGNTIIPLKVKLKLENTKKQQQKTTAHNR